MASVNKAILIGNLTKDPVTRYSQNGDAITNITIACNDTWKGKDGSKQEKVEYINITFYRKLAEIAGEYLKKGRSVYIEGRLETRKFTDKDGIERYKTEIIASDMKMLSNKQNANSNESDLTQQRSDNADTGFDDMDDVPF